MKLYITLVVTIIMLLSASAFGGSEVHDPDADIRIETGWTLDACSNAWECVSDDVYEQFVYMYDNNNDGNLILFTTDDTAIADSTIDSLNIIVSWRIDNVNNTIAIVDSVGGQTAGLRQSATISQISAGTFIDTVRYTTTADAGAFTWADIDDYCIGVVLVNNNNNKQTDITELWFEVWYHAEGGASWTPSAQVIMILNNINYWR